MNNYIDVTMETAGKWVALGHNNAGAMVRKIKYCIAVHIFFSSMELTDFYSF